MQYSFPFAQSANIIELGGGTKPYFRPNLDVRAAENVDIVADFNKPLPIENDQYDGIFSSFCIEHLSWRKVDLFLKECFRIVKPGSKVVFLTANTEEQIKHVLNHDEWEDECSRILFGDQDYDENTHRNSLCPKYAIKLCNDVGFENVIIFPFGALKTDMIIEATKPKIEDPAIKFSRKYFDDMLYFDKKEDGRYKDMPRNWIAYEKIMEMKPSSVLELGCGRGYLLRKIETQGIPVKGMDVSQHCILTRTTDNVKHYDFTQTPWPLKDKEFDLCLSVEALEYVPEEKLPDVIKEIERVCKRSYHAVNTTEQNISPKKEITTLKPRKFWDEKFGPEQITSCADFYNGSVSQAIPSGDGKLKLNIGSYTSMFHHGWINIDILPLDSYASDYQYKFVKHDIKNPFNFIQDNTVDYIVLSHVLEHVTAEEGLSFLKECHRIMKPGAVARIYGSDIEKLIEMYQKKDLSLFSELNASCEKHNFESLKLWNLLFEGHKIAYDFDGMKSQAEKAGFKIERKSFNQGNEQILKETIDFLPDLSLYVELTKP